MILCAPPHRTLPAWPVVSRDLALLLLLVVASALPFLSQPFHMDDNFYMDMARNARAQPLFPNDTPYRFADEYLRDMGSHSHPPLQTYFLAALQGLAGEAPGKERIYHAAALACSLLAAVSFYFLSALFVRRPLWPAAVLAACPLFLVMQHSFMADVPALAFWLAAVASFLWAAESQRPGLYFVSSLFQFLAMFTSYPSATLFLLLLYCQMRKRGGRVAWLSLFLPLLLMALWFGMNYAHYHRFILFDTVGYVRSRDPAGAGSLLRKLFAVLQYQGWLGIFPLLMLYLWGRVLRWRILWMALLVSVVAAQLVIPGYRLIDKAIFVAGVAAGFFVLLRFARLAAAAVTPESEDREESTRRRFLVLWYFAVFLYCLLLFTEGSARYILPMLPPALLVFFRDLEAREVAEYRMARRPLLSSAMAASGALVVSLGWGMALSQADLEFARIYPRAAREFARLTNGMEAYFGGEWGFRYYFSRSGARQLPRDEREVRGGSWIALPRLALPYDIPAPLRSMMMPVSTFAYEPSTPIRMLDHRSPAGFYSTGWGLLPFSLSRWALEEIQIAQVNFLVEAFPRAEVETPRGGRAWPTAVELGGTRLLAIEASAGSALRYPWEFRRRLRVDLQCGVARPEPFSGMSHAFVFAVRQLDGLGSVLNQAAVSITPDQRKPEQGWQSLAMALEPDGGRSVLELSLNVEPPLPGARGYWGGALLWPMP